MAKGPQFILASTSPRRKDLLTQAGIHFEVRAPEINETQKPGENPRKYVARLARKKAFAVIKDLHPIRATLYILAADTTVITPNSTVLGKPVTKAKAKQMLNKLAGCTHTVLTGYCILELRRGRIRELVRVISTRVRMRKLNSTQIARYVATGEPMDKAGAYAAQGIGMTLIDSISGSYSNVVGLPISHLISDLETHFGIRIS